MKRAVQKLSEAELASEFPIQGSVEGWRFRLTESSNGAWLAEGSDSWGRRVACQGMDEEVLLRDCEGMAQSVLLQQRTHDEA
jgi:hypothetical protein